MHLRFVLVVTVLAIECANGFLFPSHHVKVTAPPSPHSRCARASDHSHSPLNPGYDPTSSLQMASVPLTNEETALALWVLAFASSHIGMSATRSTIIASLGEVASALQLVGRDEWKLPGWWPGDSSGGDRLFPDADTAGRQVCDDNYSSNLELRQGKIRLRSAIARRTSRSSVRPPEVPMNEPHLAGWLHCCWQILWFTSLQLALRAHHSLYSLIDMSSVIFPLSSTILRSSGSAARAGRSQASSSYRITTASGANTFKRARAGAANNVGGRTITCRHLSHGKDSASALPAKANKRATKRQNIKRQVALTKREKMLSPAKTKADAKDDILGGEFAVAIKERFAPTVQSNLDSMRDHVKSMFQRDHPRAKRVGPKMDRKWWMVNIALSLSPAVMIALYCEYQRGPMEEYFKGVCEKERKRIMGEFEVDEDEADAALVELGIPLEEESKKSFSDRVADSASILYISVVAMINDNGEDADIDNDHDDDEGAMSQQTESSLAADDDAEEVPQTPTIDKNAEIDQGARTGTKVPVGEASEASIEELLRRIEALERQVQQKTAAEEREKRRRAHQLKYRLERADQSGVQNRLEDGWIDEWKKEGEEQKRKLQEAQESGGKPKIDVSLTGLIRENFRRKQEAVREFGMSTVDTVKEAVLGSSDTSVEIKSGEMDKKSNSQTGEEASASQDQSSHAVAAAVEKVAASVQESAKSTQASVDAINKKQDVGVASQYAAKAAEEAQKAANIAREASEIASIPADGSNSDAKFSSHQQQPGTLRRLDGWIKSRFGRRSGSDTD